VTGIVVSEAVAARCNWSRWIVDCSSCPSALAVPVGTHEVSCWDCGQPIGPIVWPPDPVAITTLLAMRPLWVKSEDGETWDCPRNWEPGETLEDLLRENTEHGLLPPEWLALAEASPDGRLELLGTTDQVVTSGLVLTLLPPARQINAAVRPELEG
jgi:hypothetical protein